MTFGLPSVSEVVKGQIYLGNLSAALSLEQRKKLGITHIISVCPEYPSTGSNHLAIAIDDTEYENILIHLPKACEFIQTALDGGGKVLVHCVMGISRSATTVAAYLMKSRKMDRSSAIHFIKQRRPQVHPNYGFIKQLETFAECKYEPSPTNAVYNKWKRQQEVNVTKFLNSMVDTTTIIPDQLLLSSDFPEDIEQAESLLLDLGITHIVSVSPTHVSSTSLPLPITLHHVDVSGTRRDELLVSLPGACLVIQEAIKSGGQVLVHSLVETRACIVICAFLMLMRRMTSSKAFSILEDALPLFNPTHNFSRHLELFEACGYNPTSKHPLVKEWLKSEKTPCSTPNAGNDRICLAAADLLSETNIDMAAFGDALSLIQNGGHSRT